MKTILYTFILLLIPALLFAQTEEREKGTLTTLLDEFLEGASYNDAATHDRFWAEDLIYTGSDGNRITKADIMEGVVESPDMSVAPATHYSAEEVQINLYDDAAVVAFKLVAEFQDVNEPSLYFYNTGTFVKRDGEWRAAAWQATRISE